MNTQQIETTSRELIEKWIVQNILVGKSNAELAGTFFVYGDETFSLRLTSMGGLEIAPEHEVSQVVVFRKKEEVQPVNICRACGIDYSSFKEAIECCADLD